MSEAWPHHLKGQKAILINVTRKAAIKEYIHLFWPELIVLNEVYPEPSQDEIVQLKKMGCTTYHIVGLQGKAYPSFPQVYEGGIPCCAGIHSKSIEVILKKL